MTAAFIPTPHPYLPDQTLRSCPILKPHYGFILQYVGGDDSPRVERSQQKAINLTAVMFSSSFEQTSI